MINDIQKTTGKTHCHHFMDYSFQLAARNLLYAPSHRQDSIHITIVATPVVEHLLEWEIAQWVHHEGSIQWSTAPWAHSLTLKTNSPDGAFIYHPEKVHTQFTGLHSTVANSLTDGLVDTGFAS